jgi:DNA helicase II / ATP-dependent DNA helicase PcrA
MPQLSDEQWQLVLAGGDRFAEACPGAGKTRAIAARFLTRAEAEPRKGIGLLSFTTAAIDEVKTRCKDHPEILLAPHFVGTFDGFINRFITRPVYVKRSGKTPRFRETWQGLKGATFRLRDMGKLPDIELDWFAFDGELQATLNERRMPPQYPKMFRSLISTRRQEMEARATTQCQTFVKAGHISCVASRARALGYLQREDIAETIGTLLGDRFSEIIVDEAQDCGTEELEILRLLRKFRVKVVAVADMDQSIFEFRQAEPEKVRAFTATLGTPLSLNGNWRSSPAICALNNSLRSGSQREVACGENQSCQIPVQLLEFSSHDHVAPAVEQLLATHELPHSETIFLSYRGSDARKSAGVPKENSGPGSNLVLGVAWASEVLQTASSTPKERSQAVGLIERVIRTAADVDELDESSLDERWLRDTAVRLAVSAGPTSSTPRNYAEKLRQHVKQIQWPAGITPRYDLGGFIKAPKGAVWKVSRAGVSGAFAAATVHSVKGREYASVVVVVPKELHTDNSGCHVIDYWEDGVASELRRVLYVAASRAQKLLILAVHTEHHGRVAKLLKDDGVPYEVVLSTN